MFCGMLGFLRINTPYKTHHAIDSFTIRSIPFFLVDYILYSTNVHITYYLYLEIVILNKKQREIEGNGRFN